MAERNDEPQTTHVVNRSADDQAGETAERPLPGSTTGTIGGGGPEAGPPAPRADAPDVPPFKPENIASGRLQPDPLAATHQPDPTKTPPGDTQPH